MSTATLDRPTSRRPVRIVRGQPTSDGAGVKLTRVIGTSALDGVDPFLMLDEFGSDDPAAYIAGFPPHPHRGFETITYMLAGRMRHRDNLGNEGVVGPGDLQWMTAARGVVHSEMPEQVEGLMRGFQLWLNLPATEKMLAPTWRDIPAAEAPNIRVGDAAVKVLAGEVGGATGPIASPTTRPVILDVAFDGQGAATLPLPAGHAGFVYVFEGEVAAGGEPVGRGLAAVLDDGEQLELSSSTGGRALVVAGAPLRERVARHGPFVMNTTAELIQAFEDLRSNRF